MLRIQLEVFDQNLDKAIASGMHEITFIHGIGNGVLRKEIHKRLSQIQNIKYFQDTQKDNWGYGATLVRIS
jgi:dsDNA-specific endonuclease/ATPase MutS2